MNTRDVPLLASISWIKNAVELMVRRPFAVFGGAAVLSLLPTIPSGINYLLHFFVPAGNTLERTMLIIGALFMVLVFLPMFGGYFRLMHRVGHDAESPSPLQLLEPYRIERMAARLVGFFALFTLGYGVILIVLRLVGLPEDFLQRPSLQNIQIMPLLFTALMMSLVTALLGIGLGEIAVSNHHISDAFGTAFRGFKRNFKTFFMGALLIPILMSVAALMWAGLMFMIVWPISKIPGATTELATAIISWIGSLPFVAFLFALLYSVWQDVVAAEIKHDDIL